MRDESSLPSNEATYRKKLLDSGRQVLLPQLLVVVEHVRLAAHSADLAGLAVANIDTLVVIQRDRLAEVLKVRIASKISTAPTNRLVATSTSTGGTYSVGPRIIQLQSRMSAHIAV